MPLSFLTVFPREIRDLIYTYILCSPTTGTVTLSPWTIEVARSLWIMRTCHQIHHECKEIIWRDNKMLLPRSQPSQLCTKFHSLLCHPAAYNQFQQLKMHLEMLDRDELEWFLQSAPALLEYGRKGKLLEVTLVTSFSKPAGLKEFLEFMELREYGEVVDGRFFLEKNTRTKTVITTGWPRFSHWGKQRWFKEMLLDSNGILEILQEIHRLFGGRLYVNGCLCLENGKQVGEGINGCGFDPRNGEIRIEPRVSSRLVMAQGWPNLY